MPGQRLPMRQVREVLRLKHVCGHSGHQIAAMVGISRYTVAEYLRRAGVVGITWPVPAELDDTALERQLFSPPFAAGEPARLSQARKARSAWLSRAAASTACGHVSVKPVRPRRMARRR
jgi:transposase